MIEIKNKHIKIDGKFDELHSDIIKFIELFSNSNKITKLGIGKGYDDLVEFFNIETLLRYIFTICSLDENEFKFLIDSIIKIMKECENDKFKLFFKN